MYWFILFVMLIWAISALIGLYFFMHWPRPADFTIGPRNNPQTLRWHVIPRNRWFNIYLHHFLRSDDDRALHDHPWINVSVVLKGEYLEVVPRIKNLPLARHNLSGVMRRPFRPVFRLPTWPHRVMLSAPVWSLFITGPNVRTWGFHCPNGWVPFYQFVTRYEGGDQRGKGCE